MAQNFNPMTIQEQIKRLLKELSKKEQVILLNELRAELSVIQIAKKNRSSSSNPIALKGIEIHGNTDCPNCKSSKVVKNGKRNNIQKYKCKSCSDIFTASTGTCMHKVKKTEKFEAYKTLMFTEYLSLKEMAKAIGISSQTAFDWRHKILGGLKQEDTKFEGITEMDDVWFLYSQKGRKGLKYSRERGGSKRRGDNDFQTKLLITRDRNTNIDMSVTCIGRIKEADIANKVGGKFSSNCTLVSDKHSSIAAFARTEQLNHVSFKAKKHTATKEHHVQTVNNNAARIKAIVDHRLRGVSTKYLQSYVNWFSIKEQKITDDALQEKLYHNRNAWELHTNFEPVYKGFIENHSKRTYRCPVLRNFKCCQNKKVDTSKFNFI